MALMGVDIDGASEIDVLILRKGGRGRQKQTGTGPTCEPGRGGAEYGTHRSPHFLMIFQPAFPVGDPLDRHRRIYPHRQRSGSLFRLLRNQLAFH